MKIGIIGAGNVGVALAKRLGMAGHQLMLSFSNNPNALMATARRYVARAGTPAEAANFGDVAVLATPWTAVELALSQAGRLHGQVLWDCTVPLSADRSVLVVGATTSGGEIIAERARGARVVKAIPPAARLLLTEDPTVDGKPAAMFLCSDDAGAKALVMPLATALPAQAIDFGPLSNSRYTEPLGMAIVHLAYGLNHGQRIGFSLLAGDAAAAPPSHNMSAA